MGPTSVVFIDYETTGLNIGLGDIPLEIGMVAVNPITRRETRACSYLILPENLEREEWGTRIHGLGPEQTARGLEPGKVVSKIDTFLRGLKTDGHVATESSFCLVAHNAGFDESCHHWLLGKANLDSGCHGSLWCTAKGGLFPGKNMALWSIAKRHLIARRRIHRALPDARLLAHLAFLQPEKNWLQCWGQMPPFTLPGWEEDEGTKDFVVT